MPPKKARPPKSPKTAPIPVVPARLSPRESLIESALGWLQWNGKQAKLLSICKNRLQFDQSPREDVATHRRYFEALTDGQIKEEIEFIKELCRDIDKEIRDMDRARHAQQLVSDATHATT